jgi:hypothetical protein
MKMLIGTGFILITIVFYGLFLRQVPSRRILFVLTGWAIFLAIWSLSGIASRFDLAPLNLMPVLVIPLITILVFTFKTKTVIPQKSLIQLQVFRVFVELLLWALFIENLLPVQMTFEGRNWDVISGLTAPFAALFLQRSKWGLAIWNIICLGLLINVMSIAVLSMPTPLRIFENEPANTIVTEFPFILLPGMLVPLAYGLSLLSLRQIFSVNSPNEEVTSYTPVPRSVQQ